MAHYWILIMLSWLSAASPQYINTAVPGAESLIDPLDFTLHYPPLPYVNYLNIAPTRNDYETLQNNDPVDRLLVSQDQTSGQRKRRTAEEVSEEAKEKRWQPNLVDKDKTIYIHGVDKGNPFIVGFAVEDNSTFNSADKRSFSPWGGKRGNTIEHMWSWKRSPGVREPSMPKRVRFSPWGGKRSGQMVYKPGTKGSKIIFSASVPELTRIISNYSPNDDKQNLPEYRFIPSLDKRHPIKILGLSTQMDDRTYREAMPFKKFLESLPKSFKPGHPYLDVNLNKDGKRKVKFSAWGGKRSPPIIGPIWAPASQDIKDAALDSIVLIRNTEEFDDLGKTV